MPIILFSNICLSRTKSWSKLNWLCKIISKKQMLKINESLKIKLIIISIIRRSKWFVKHDRAKHIDYGTCNLWLSIWVMHEDNSQFFLFELYPSYKRGLFFFFFFSWWCSTFSRKIINWIIFHIKMVQFARIISLAKLK